MLKKIMLILTGLVLTMQLAFASVDINKADQAALDSIKGIGPAKSHAILEARKSGGDFKDWVDLQKRVKGIGSKNAQKLSQAGLTINGQAYSTATKTEKKEPLKRVEQSHK